jgi:hypothetical protein
MGVPIQRNCDRRMAQQFLYEFRMHATDQQQGRRGVAQVVKPDGARASLFRCAGEQDDVALARTLLHWDH